MFDKLKKRLKKKSSCDKKYEDGGLPMNPEKSDDCAVKIRGTCIKSPKAFKDGGLPKKKKC